MPRFPIRTALAHVGVLQSNTGAFVREFAACYQNRGPIGGCAAIVNPTRKAVALPHLDQSYHRSLALTGSELLAGGSAAWRPGIPAVLDPASAVVIAR